MKAILKNNRQSPRKVRLVADMLRGKNVSEALLVLNNVPKKASLALRKLLESAIANAKEQGQKIEDLYVKEVRVDEGVTLKRFMPVWRGMAHPIRKRSSHIQIILDSRK